EQPVPGKRQPADGAEATFEDLRRADIVEFRSKDELDHHLQDDAYAPGGEQRLQWPIVDPLDDAAFDDQPEKPDQNQGDRNREEVMAAELADHGGGIGAVHDQLAVSHIDHAG